MHDAYTIGIPTFVVLIGILLSRRDSGVLKTDTDRQFDELRSDMSRQFAEIHRRLDVIDGDLKHFHNVTGRLEGRIEELSRR